MRGLLALLVAANLLAFAWWQGWLDPWVGTSREPERLAAQVAPDKLRVVPVERLDAAIAAMQARCLEVGPLEDALLQRVAIWAAGLGERAQGELARPVYRVSFTAPVDEADLKQRAAELARIAGREPVPCADAADAKGSLRPPAGRR